MTDASALAARAKTTLYARPANYGVAHLHWSFISSGWDSITLVRNLDGYPTSITDGEVLNVWTTDPAQAVTYLGVSSKYHFFDTGESATSGTTNPGKGVTGTVLQGKTAYYGLFVTYTTSGNQYVSRSAVESTLVVKDDGMLDALLSCIPSVYKSENSDLEDFLGLFAFHLSLYKQEATDVFEMSNPTTVNSKLLTALLKQFGASLYGDMSVAQGRVLLANLIDSYTKTGSIEGIKNFIELYTGYGASIASTPVPGGGVNMLLDYNSASFVESTGSWRPATNGDTAFDASAPYNPFISWVQINEGSVYPYGHSGSDAYQGVFKEKGFLKMAAVLGGTQDVTLKLGPKVTLAVTATAGNTTMVCKPLIAKVGDYVINSSVEPGTYVTAVTASTATLTLSRKLTANISAGTEVWFSPVAVDKQSALEAMVPIASSTAYTFSAFFNRDSYTGKSVKLAIMWYDKSGAYLSTSSYGTTLNTASGSANTWQRATVTATSPSTGRYAMPIVTFISCSNGDIMYMDGVQFEAGSSATTFQDARVVNITVKPTRINQVLNPSFETNANYWWSSTNIAPILPSSSGSSISRTNASYITGSYAGSVTLTTPAPINGTVQKSFSSTTATITTTGNHNYTTGDIVAVRINVVVGGKESVFSGAVTTTANNVFTIPCSIPAGFSATTCKSYKIGVGGSNVGALVPEFNELVPITSASYDIDNNIVVTTEWPVYLTAGSSIQGGSTVANDMTNTSDIQSTIVSVTNYTTFTASGTGTNTSSLFDNNAYVFSKFPAAFFMARNIYFNNSTSVATNSGITINANSQYAFSVGVKLSSALASGVGVAAIPYILTNPDDGINYRIDNLPTIKGVSSDGSVATFYTNVAHQFSKGDKVHILGLPANYYIDAADTIPMSDFNTTNTNKVYTITEVGNKYFKATRTTAMYKTSASKTYFTTGDIAYAAWDLSTNWVRMSVPGCSIGLTLGSNNYTKAIAGVYIAQTFDANNTGATFTVLLDNALFETGSKRQFYFDGHYDGHSLYDAADRDTKWAGTADASKSYYYKDWLQAQARLKDNLPDSILYGSGTLGVGPGWSALYNLTYSE